MAKDDTAKPKAADANALRTPGENLQGERGDQTPDELMEAQMGALVASPTGPVPMSAVTDDAERAKELREERNERLKAERNHPRAGQLLTEDQVRAMNGAERRAVAQQRGYQVPGRRISVERFLALQQDDEFLDEGTEETTKKKGKK